MKATIKTRTGRILIEVAGETVKDLFRAVSQVQDVFDAGAQCGACSSTDTQLRTRVIDDNEYFEAHCLNCRASLHFGQHKKGGTLFPKRDKGWTVYEPSRSAAPPLPPLPDEEPPMTRRRAAPDFDSRPI